MKDLLKTLWGKIVITFDQVYSAGLEMWNKYSILMLCAIIGLSITGDIATFVIVCKVIGIISAFLIISAMALDDREGKGLFPSYDEDKLIELAKGSPVASALIVLGKNALMAIILILAVLFVRP